MGSAQDATSTFDLITAVRSGDEQALERLYQKYVPELRDWASGRLPQWARDLSDTNDLVQETVVRVFARLDGFEYRGEGALRAYLRQSLLNRIRNEIRRARSRPAGDPLDSGLVDPAPSPMAQAISEQAIATYSAALSQLSPDERELVIARVDLGLTYQEMVTVLGKPSADAARMAVARALVKLTDHMGRECTPVSARP